MKIRSLLYQMFEKKDFYVLDKINDGPFWETVVVKTYGIGGKRILSFFEARLMKKVHIIQLDEEENVVSELEDRLELNNRYICNIIDKFQDYDRCFIISELPKGGYLYYYLKGCRVFKKNVARILIAQIICAIQYIHKKGELYRFLAPETIMVTENGNVKLRYDFMNKIGLTQKKYKENIEYIPIEYLKNQPLHRGSDYWCIGIILYEFLFGVTPFAGNSFEETCYNIRNKRLTFPRYLDDDVEDLLSKLLDRFDFRRLGSLKKDKKRIRKHPFFEGLNWEMLEGGLLVSGIQTVQIDFFKNKGRKMSDLYKGDYKKDQVDGYGVIFDKFGNASKINYSKDY